MADRLSIVFVGTARDSAAHLPTVLKNLDGLCSLGRPCGFVFCENDSTDGTKSILTDWGRARSGFELIQIDGLGRLPQRTLRLEMARNVIVERIRTMPSLREADYVVAMDCDEANTMEFDLAQFSRAMAWIGGRPDVAGIFPNQTPGPYYDLWALRHPTWCPGDVWEEVLDYQTVHRCDDASAYAATFARRIFALAPSAEPLEVQSAFGGLGIYRMSFFLKNPNPYLGQKIKAIHASDGRRIVRWQQCEHVHFHAGLGHIGGRLFVLPFLINGNTGSYRFVQSWHRRLVF